MILLPLVLLQAVALQMFYGSHLDVVSRRLTGERVGEIAYTLELLNRYPREVNAWILRNGVSPVRSGDPGAEPGAVLPQ